MFTHKSNAKRNTAPFINADLLFVLWVWSRAPPTSLTLPDRPCCETNVEQQAHTLGNAGWLARHGQGSEGLALSLYGWLWTNFISCVSPLCPNSREELRRVERLQEARREYCTLVRSLDHTQAGRAGHWKLLSCLPKSIPFPGAGGSPGARWTVNPPSLKDAGDTDFPEQAGGLKTVGPAQISRPRPHNKSQHQYLQ